MVPAKADVIRRGFASAAAGPQNRRAPTPPWFNHLSMRLATRLFAITGVIVAGTTVAVILLAGRIVRQHFADEIAGGLEREAKLVAQLVPADSARWPEAARTLGRLIARRVTLIAGDGRVRGDADFDRAALAGLENHLGRPEVRVALEGGVGRAQRLSGSTNERLLHVAVPSVTPGLAVVRVSTTLASVDAEIGAVRRAIALAGLGALVLAALSARLAAHALAGPFARLGGAARDIAAGRQPSFPDSAIPEVAGHIASLRTMHAELDRRFEDLKHEREETAMLIEAMADGVLAADAQGHVTAMNAAARQLLGYGPAAALPPLEQLFHQRRARDLVGEIMAGGDIDQQELDVGGRNLLATGRRLPDGGSLLVLRDVTALRRLETVRRDFVANVSHELKTPLTSIAGYAETLAQEIVPGQSRQFAETILHNARRMHRLVDDLLDLSRIESGGWRPNPQRTALGRVIPDAWAPVAETARLRGVDLQITPPTQDGILWADEEGLRQILTNLFDNAVRHTPAGGHVTVSVREDSSGTTVTVTDTGTGIPAEHLPRIFERFYRVDPARSRDQGGTGLGLAIVKHLTEAHDGRVTAESALGRGTTIRLFFPSPPTAA